VQKTLRIHLVRHGKPDISRDVWLSRPEYRAWWKRYGDVGLAPDNSPPEATIAAARKCRHFVASSLLRARETAQALSEGADIECDPKYVEAALPPPIVLPFLKGKPIAWGTYSRVIWWLGYAGGEESHTLAKARAVDCAETLAQLSQKHGETMLCGHGWFNRMIAKRLRQRGWKRDNKGSDAHWAVRSYVKIIETEDA
jgi:broad specificity phosphatase PhoE